MSDNEPSGTAAIAAADTRDELTTIGRLVQAAMVVAVEVSHQHAFASELMDGRRGHAELLSHLFTREHSALAQAFEAAAQLIGAPNDDDLLQRERLTRGARQLLYPSSLSLAATCLSLDVSSNSSLRPLPATRYIVSRWKGVKVNIDYHVEFEAHYYSVPHLLEGAKIDVRVTGKLLEINEPKTKTHRRPRETTFQADRGRL